jgi:hypothetical protein
VLSVVSCVEIIVYCEYYGSISKSGLYLRKHVFRMIVLFTVLPATAMCQKVANVSLTDANLNLINVHSNGP